MKEKFTFRIKKLILQSDQEIETGNLTVFVGPNNSGKSRILKDILSLTTTSSNQSFKIVKDIDFTYPNTIDEFLDAYPLNIINEGGNSYIRALHPTMLTQYQLNITNQFWKKDVESWLRPDSYGPATKKNFAGMFGSLLLMYLSTEDRLKLVRETNVGPITENMQSTLGMLYFEGVDAERELQQIVKSTFGFDIRLDYSNLSSLCLRIADDLSQMPVDPREARKQFASIEKIDEHGDGVKNFVASYLAIRLGGRPVILLDEPEVFLHPPQAQRLGEIIANAAKKGQQIFVSTHSADLLQGILNTHADANVIRLERDKNSASYYLLDRKLLANIIANPLLSSSRILEGIFYKGVVVTEADSDSVFYRRISRQISENDDIHYTHAHNKQTVSKVAEPYRKLGVRFCVVVDFDVIRDKVEFKKLLNANGFEKEMLNEILQLRQDIVNEIEAKSSEDMLDNLNSSLKKLLKENQQADFSPEEKLSHAKRELKRIADEN